ncbi:MAG TPA: pentapeptide repeat-containing protein, partial [Spirochaetia bacterium]|nr:pentapeptide repeat-containing protein [Spirochaetia bacterium]
DIELIDSALEHNSMAAASIHDLRMDHGTLDRSSFSGTKLKDVMIRGQSSILASDFSGCGVSNLRLEGESGGSSLKGSRLSGARVSDVLLRSSTIEDADFSGSSLHDLKMMDSGLVGCKFRGSSLHNVEIASSHLDGCRMDGVGLDDVKVEGSRLVKVQFLGAMDHFRRQVHDVQIRDSTLDGVVFDGCVLQGTRIEGVTASGLRLRGKDLSRMTITSAEALEELAQK